MDALDLGSNNGRRAAWRALLGIGLLAGLAACGKKGPLYLPEQTAEARKKTKRDGEPESTTSEPR